jgi:hypothetical protein
LRLALDLQPLYNLYLVETAPSCWPLALAI